ncbi:stage V sporulation protein AA [Oceanobacillus manasiensis]|uniref:stage V sporulation protein AA n=1 Tax=Oceanobacillus manasiensis TaxID=586413 RepID=UPI0005A66D00|nr:stage V sporulation protein AA [Oceanobacillus manasiensis]
MSEIVYLRMKKHLEVTSLMELKLKDIVYISAKPVLKKKLEPVSIYRLSKNDQSIVIIDGFVIIDHLSRLFKDMEFQLIGPNQTIVRIIKKSKSPSILFATIVWLILFIGTAMTLMNFHYDVSMQEVQQKLHFLLTGEENEYPLWIQIPYSLGLGLGMLLFFNHWFNRRFNEEPSPLEVEIHKYQQDLDNYVIQYESELNDRKPFN